MTWFLLKSSLTVATVSTLLAVCFGLVGSICVAGLGGRWRQFFFVMAVLPLLWPPFLIVNCWLELLGDTGVWRGWFPWSILSLWGTVWVLALLKWPITFLLVSGALGRMDPALLESDLQVSGWNLMRWIVWPQTRGAVSLASVITFVLCFSEFSVPSILQVKVFTTEIWINFNTTFNYLGVLATSWPLVLAPLLLLVAFRRQDIPLRWQGLQSAAVLFRQQLGALHFWAVGVAVLVCGFSVLLPAGQLVLDRRTWLEFVPAWAAGSQPLWNSALFSISGALACLGLGALVVHARFGSALWLPFFLPGVLLGIAIVWLLNRPGLRWVGQSSFVVILAFALRYAALARLALRRWLSTIPLGLREDAALIGAGRLFFLRHVFWPAQGGRLLALTYLAYLLILWDVETLVMIVPAGGETLALRIFNLLHYGHNGQVSALCLLMVLLGAAPVLAFGAARKIWLGFHGRRVARSSP